MNLRLEALSYSFGSTTALRDITVDLDGPGVIGLLGPNGAGKTTLMRLLATIYNTQAGTYLVDGRRIESVASKRSFRRRIGYLPQNFSYHPRLTVRDLLQYVAWLKEVDPLAAPDTVAAALLATDLTDLAERTLRTLSGGMLRRAGIAQALVNEPELLLLDEPTAGLDPAQRLEFRRLMSDMGAKSLIILATHLIEDVSSICDEVVVLSEGSAVFVGTKDQLASLAGEAVDEPRGRLEAGYMALLSPS